MVQGRSRSTTTIQPSGPASPRKGSVSGLLEQRRRSTMTKLKGLVIPESVSETASSGPGHKGPAEKVAGSAAHKSAPGPSLPNPPWKDKSLSEDCPKYSPAFKRKPFTVYGPEGEAAPAPRSQKQPAYKPPIGKKNSDEGSTVLRTEPDSDNDSAVSSGRSSLSCRSCTPPASPKAASRERQQLNNRTASAEQQQLNPRVLKKNSVEAVNRQNVINAGKRSSATDQGAAEQPRETSSPRQARSCGRPASRSSSFTIAERKKSFESPQPESRRGSHSSHDSGSRKTSASAAADPRLSAETEPSARSCVSRVSNYPDSIMDIEEKVAFMSDMVDRAASVTPTERRSLSRTPSVASERSSYSSRSSRNSSIVSEKAPFARNSSIMSKDSAISEDISKEIEEKSSKSEKKWSDLEKKYSRGLSSGSIGETISKLSKSSDDGKNERPKDLMIAQKKMTSGISSPSSKNFKELAEKWQTLSVPETPGTPVSGPGAVPALATTQTLPRRSSKEEPSTQTLPRRGSKEETNTQTLPRRSSKEETANTQTLPRRGSKEEAAPVTPQPGAGATLPRRSRDKAAAGQPSAWSPPAAVKGSYYQVNGGEAAADWSGFELSGKCEVPDRKYSVPAFNEAAVKLRDRKDNVPSRPSSLIESSDQKDLKIFEIGNLGDSGRLLLSNCTSQSSSQADLLDTHSVTSDTPKSPLPSSSSREILDVFSNR